MILYLSHGFYPHDLLLLTIILLLHFLDCVAFTKNSSNYAILTKLHAPSGNTSFWVKLWNPDDEKKVYTSIYLFSMLDYPNVYVYH